ncbi:phosphatase PAP2 family protein [Atopobacter phocae]|uniref:phosphatase PAP2 family protein n=1 Tax=Atopobacter phocae TaxID=136492 RepID=UPI0004B709B7|nr:phosphatase PAP2 family protein [Atopobacter phocae]
MIPKCNIDSVRYIFKQRIFIEGNDILNQFKPFAPLKKYIGFIFLFMLLTIFVKFQPLMVLRVDKVIIDIIQSAISPAMTQTFKGITFLANELTIAVLVLTFSLFIYFYTKKRTISIWFLSTQIIGALLNLFVKLTINRPRPEFLRLIPITGLSYPSGHAMGSVIFYSIICWWIIHQLKRLTHYQLTRQQFIYQSLLYCCAMIFPLLIGISRVYLGVHYPSDVLGGWVLGYITVRYSIDIYQYLERTGSF